MALHLAQDAAADKFLDRDHLGLLIGMLLDQQFPMERAFGSPHLLAQRLGVKRLDARQLARHDPEDLRRVFTGPPALHRFPGAMAARVQALCQLLVDNYAGDAATLWSTADSGTELLARVEALPGFGAQKARIFVALLGKQLRVRPAGWREVAGAYGEDGAHRSVADVTGPDSLAAVREHKRSVKAAAKKG
ncbi:MAG: Fe-S cluster assembly protein HesB [Actinomycetota bacterium]|nr:Fe-S cluster assembly protein HesB [Actinomycetota bacterium]